MAVRTWSSAASNDMNLTTNYDGAGSFATDDLVFNATSVVNAAATADITCNSITITNGYTGTWALTGYTANCAQGFSDDGVTGGHNYGNGITCGGASATLHVGSGVGTITATSCALTMNGTTAMVIDDDKGVTFLSLTLGASAIVTNSGGAASTYQNTTSAALTIGNNATFTSNQTINWQLTGTGTVFSIGTGVTFNGSGTNQIRINGSGITITIPAVTYTGSGTWSFNNLNANAGTIQLGGTFNIGTSLINLNLSVGNYSWSTQNNAFTCGIFRAGSSTVGKTLTLNIGSSTCSISSYDGSTTNVGPTTLNMSTSTWTCTGAWTFGSNHTVDEGTSSVTFSGTGATNTVTSNGKMFYDVTLNKTATAGVTFADATSLHSLTVSGTNTQAISWTGTTMTASGNITIDGSGTLNCGNGITMSGASATLHLGSTLSTVTASSCAVTMNGTTGMVIDDDKGVTFKSWTLGASAIVTSSGGANSDIIPTTGVGINIGNNSTLTINRQLTVTYSNSSGTFMTLGSGYTFNGSANLFFKSNQTSTLSFPGINYSGSGTITISTSINAGTHVMNITGAISTTGILIFLNDRSGNSSTFNTNGNAITCTSLRVGSSGATSTMVISWGASVVSCSTFDASTYNIGTSITHNLNSASFSVSGNWTWGTLPTAVPGTSTVTITNTSTITSNGESFYNFRINAAAKTITLADSLNIASGGSVTVTAFTAFAGNQYIIFAGSGSITIATNVSNRLRTAVAGSVITWNTGASKWTFPAYTAGDWQGSAASRVRWVSSSPGTYYNVAAPAGVVSSYMSYTDTNNSTGTTIDAMNGTNQNGGHTVNINFPASSSIGQSTSRSRIAISMGI